MSASLPPPPKGWLDVEEAVGTPIGRTRLLLCKAPLSATRFNVPAARAFTPAMLVQQQRDMGRQIKYVVQVSVRPGAASAAAADCVSDRSEFYDATVELRPHGCQFVHVQMELDPEASAPGVSTLDPRARPCPISARSIEQFVRVLRGIMAATEAAEEHERKKAAAAAAASSAAAAASSSSSTAPLPAFVAVHDLYGYNLCGFLLTCFLCEEYGMDVGQAVGDVGDSRPPGIYVAALLQSLLARYNDPDEEALAGGMLAAAASGAPGNVQIAKLTCIPLIPELPRPDWHHLPWAWSGAQMQSTSSAPAASAATSNGPSDPAAAAAAALAAPGEEFKRKIRKKAAPAVAPAPSISASPLPSAAAPPSSAAGAAAAAAAAAPKRPFAEFAPPADEPAIKRAKVAAPSPISAAVAVASNGPRSPQPRFAVQPPAPRSPQPLFHVQPSALAAPAAAASSSNGSAAADASASDLVAQLKRDHPFLVPVRADKLPSLQAVLAQVFPPATAAKFKVGGSGDAYAFLRPPALTGEVLKQLQHGPASSRAPFMLSWLPQHRPCLMLLLRDHVYLIFDQQNWCLVPHMHFPKRKTPQDNVNNTLLLGELIVDPVAAAPGSSAAPTQQSRFLACDLLVMSQTPLLSMMGLEQRLSTMEVELIQPLKAMQAAQPASAAAPHPQLHIRNKAHFALAKIESVLQMKVPHVHEGIVLRMSGKEKDAAKSGGFQFVWRKNSPGDVSVDDLMQLAKKKYSGAQ